MSQDIHRHQDEFLAANHQPILNVKHALLSRPFVFHSGHELRRRLAHTLAHELPKGISPKYGQQRAIAHLCTYGQEWRQARPHERTQEAHEPLDF
jgi:hypothetical protein